MWIKHPLRTVLTGGDIAPSEITPRAVFENRRRVLQAAGLAAAGGLLWCVGRILYALGYYRDPARRGIGFIIGMVACGALVAGSVIGLLSN